MEVYIVFTDTKTSWAKLIKSYTRYPFSHVSLSFSQDLSQMYSFSFGKKQAGKAFSGFVKEDVRDSLFQQADCAVYKWEMTEESYGKVWGYVQKIEREQALLKYNFSGLLAVVLNYHSKRKDAYFCSQFVAEALTAGNVWVADKPPSLVTPRDLIACGSVMIHSGYVQDYPFLASSGEHEHGELVLGAVK